AGSLRAAVASAADGDTVDLTHLSCSRITLTSGRIATSHALLLIGPGSARLTIDGNGTDRIFEEDANVELALYFLSVANGYSYSRGGCISSAGPLLLDGVTVSGCRVISSTGIQRYEGGGVFAEADLSLISTQIVGNEVYSPLGIAFGGGVSARGELILQESTITTNVAHSGVTNGHVAAGGAYVRGNFVAKYSIVSNNTAASPFVAEHDEAVTGVGGGLGGGVTCGGTATVRYSTISGNAAGYMGGLAIFGNAATSSSLLLDSTVTGNHATQGSVGGVFSLTPITIANSTIAFNTETNSLGAGLYEGNYAADLESTIIADNGGGSPPLDIGANGMASFTGANNLVMRTGTAAVPADTLHGDPHLLPLADNGGMTRVHALAADSIAIGSGNNVQSVAFDQRGYTFARIVGAVADIGAFEFNPDQIFASGFQ
ncbi:MAG TPA: choice-of-anchor Q domain-containing protein, partial [Rhodanobacteraceae bacterium]